jgi:bifunctional non-homologous end joining protein LigD
MPRRQPIGKRRESAFVEPMQCTPVTALPASEKWSFEIKLDGYRCIAVKRGNEVTLFSRHQKVLDKRFPGVMDALSSLGRDFVLDGELVALDSQGRPSFRVLQNNLSRSLPVYLYCFDLLNRDGETLVSLPLEQRRELLHGMRVTTRNVSRASGSASTLTVIASAIGPSSRGGAQTRPGRRRRQTARFAL